MRFGVSTSSLGDGVLGPDDIIRFFEELSFPKFLELNYRIPGDILPALRKELLSRDIEVYSVHNFLPSPPFKGPSASFSEPLNLASLDDDERKLAVKYTLKTMDTLLDFEGKVLVLHCGKVPMDEPFRELVSFFKKGDPLLEKRVKEILEERKRLSSTSLPKLLLSLDTIAERAYKEDVCVGLENRLHITGLPFSWEFLEILREFEGAPLYYWHDVGHGEVMKRLGFMDPVEQLEALKDRVIGFHLHDVKGLEDHLPPGMGDVDYDPLFPFMEGKAVLYEIKEGFPEEDIRRGHQYFVAIKGDRQGAL